jgi:hypothetical protein
MVPDGEGVGVIIKFLLEALKSSVSTTLKKKGPGNSKIVNPTLDQVG